MAQTPFGPGAAGAARAAASQRGIRQNLNARAEDMAGRLGADGGFTYDPRQDRYVGEGVAVSKGGERRMGGAATAGDVSGFYAPRADAMASDPAMMAGGWRAELPDGSGPDDVLDASYVYPTMGQAQRVGRQHGEEAVFDLSTFEEHPVDHGMESYGGSKPYEVKREENAVVMDHIAKYSR